MSIHRITSPAHFRSVLKKCQAEGDALVCWVGSPFCLRSESVLSSFRSAGRELLRKTQAIQCIECDITLLPFLSSMLSVESLPQCLLLRGAYRMGMIRDRLTLMTPTSIRKWFGELQAAEERSRTGADYGSALFTPSSSPPSDSVSNVT